MECSLIKQKVVLREVHPAANQHGAVEDLVTGTTQVELAWVATLWHPSDVDQRAKNVNTAAHSVPQRVGREFVGALRDPNLHYDHDKRKSGKHEHDAANGTPSP